MDAILDKIIRFDHLNVIGVFRKEEGNVFYYLKTRKKNDKLEVAAVKTFTSIEYVKSEVDAKFPLILLVDGKGILNKKIDVKNETDLNWLKNLDYATIHHTAFVNDNFQFLSFGRRNVVEEEIEMFQGLGYQIADFYVGAIVAVVLNDSLKLGSLLSNDSLLRFEGDELEDIAKLVEKEGKVYDFGNVEISNFHLPLYGAVIHFYFQQKSIIKSRSARIDKEEIVYKKAFNVFGIIMVLGFFIALLASYFGVQYFMAENAKLNLENVYSNQSYQLIQELEKQRENKLRILKETGFASSKFISFYAHQISKDTPPEIRLSSLDVFPLLKEVKTTEKVALTSGTILLKGETMNELAFNSWLETLRKLDWIGNFEILSFKKDKKNNSQFEIKIVLKDV